MRAPTGDAVYPPRSTRSGLAARSQRGFTMVEVLIALMLSGIGLAGVLGTYLAAARSSTYSRHTSEAAVLAQDRLEQLRTQAPAAATGSDVNINERGVATGIFTRSWTVTLGTGYADIVVTMTWTDDGVARSFVLRGRRDT